MTSLRILLSSVLIALTSSACFGIGSMRPPNTVAVETLRDNQEDLPALVLRELQAGRLAEAFYIAEAYKTQAFAAPRLAARDPASAGVLARAHRDLRPVFSSMFKAADPLLAQRGLQFVTDEAPELRSASDKAEGLYWDHLQIIEARFDAMVPYAHILRNSFAPTSVAEAGLLFARDELFVSYVIHKEQVYAFLVHRGKISAKLLDAPTSELRQMVRALRAELHAPPPPGHEEAWRVPARALYEKLLGPFGEHLASGKASSLYISPDGFLGNVPYGVLIGDQGALIDHLRVSYLPSASVYRNILQREVLNEPPQFLAVGNPAYPEGVAPLAYAELEADTLSFVFDEATLLTGEAANEETITGLTGSHNILHFATHGVLLGNTVPGASSLMLADGETHDGFLSAAEIAALDLRHTYLAVLSACETSVAGGDASNLGSITSAFMTAGVPAVVGSLWKVSDTSTTRLMLDFYRYFLSDGAGEAMRRAQLALRGRPEYAHPYFWAAFVLYGWDK